MPGGGELPPDPQPRVSKLHGQPGNAFKQPWTASLYDQLRLFSVQLLCSGGSGALAKTAVAPLERIKASRGGGPGCDGLGSEGGCKAA